MALLSRVAGRLYWAARYIERAEDTARVIRAYQELAIDQSGPVRLRWEPLASIAGAVVAPGESADGGEDAVMQLLIADRANPGSISSSVAMARENLRTTREVMPREAWLTLNALSQHVEASAPTAVSRQFRDRFLAEVVGDSRQLDGVIESTMTRAHPYRMWRMGRLVERADMTTRVVGVRAASLLHAQIEPSVAAQALGGSRQTLALTDCLHDEVQWMGVLRSVSALQMYQRATRGPIDGATVVRFLLFYSPFPRSVQGCLDELRSVVMALPSPQDVIEQLDQAQTVLDNCDPIVSDGVALDLAMEDCQRSIAAVHSAILTRFVEW
jgi:uncharacterized alpha-E superfamily protein